MKMKQEYFNELRARVYMKIENDKNKHRKTIIIIIKNLCSCLQNQILVKSNDENTYLIQ